VRAQLPDQADVPQLLAQLGARARQSGLSIEEFTPSGEADKGFYFEIPFNVKVTGSFHEISTFIYSVGHMDRIMNVSNLQMQNPRIADSQVSVSAEFTIKTYRFGTHKASEKKK